MKLELKIIIEKIDDFLLENSMLVLNCFDGLYVIKDNNYNNKTRLSDKAFSYRFINGTLYYQIDNCSDIYVIELGSSIKNIIIGRFYLSNVLSMNNYLYLRGKDNSGKVVFKVNVNSFEIEKLDEFNIPLIYSGVFGVDSLGDSIWGYNILSNKEEWRCKIKDGQSIKGNLFLLNKTLIIPTSDSKLIGVNIENGKALWQIDNCHNYYTQHQITGNLYVLGNDVYQVVDPNEGRIVFEKDFSKENERYKILPVIGGKIFNNGLYFISNTFGCKFGKVNIDTQEVEFVQNLGVEDGVTAHSPVWHQGRIYVLDSKGVLHIFEE